MMVFWSFTMFISCSWYGRGVKSSSSPILTVHNPRHNITTQIQIFMWVLMFSQQWLWKMVSSGMTPQSGTYSPILLDNLLPHPSVQDTKAADCFKIVILKILGHKPVQMSEQSRPVRKTTVPSASESCTNHRKWQELLAWEHSATSQMTWIFNTTMLKPKISHTGKH